MEGDARVTPGDRVQLLKRDNSIPDGVAASLLGRGRLLSYSNTEIRAAVQGRMIFI